MVCSSLPPEKIDETMTQQKKRRSASLYSDLDYIAPQQIERNATQLTNGPLSTIMFGRVASLHLNAVASKLQTRSLSTMVGTQLGRGIKRHTMMFSAPRNQCCRRAFSEGNPTEPAKKTMMQRWLGPKEMPVRGTFQWYREMVLLCTVFAITGSSTMFLVSRWRQNGLMET